MNSDILSWFSIVMALSSIVVAFSSMVINKKSKENLLKTLDLLNRMEGRAKVLNVVTIEELTNMCSAGGSVTNSNLN